MSEAFDRLSESERRALRLLAQGHTAKSVAEVESCTVNAVNERLREARRKTGVGSSRDLARRLAAQENRHEQTGVATPSPSSEVSDQRSDPRRNQRRTVMFGVVIVGSLSLVAATVGHWQTASPPMQIAPTDDLFAPQHERLTKALEREQRDDVWATKVEPALDRRFATIASLARREVRCGTTMCQVSGRLAPTPQASLDDDMRELQGRSLDADLRKLGLLHLLSSFRAAKGGAPASYVAFWRRAPAG